MSEEERIVAGRYRLLEHIGSGGMGVVWRADDERLRRTVAVKQLRVPAELSEPQGEEMVRRTMREGRIAARLHHPQLITVYDVVTDGGQPYLIMEYFPSKSLAERGTLPYDEVARIGAEAAAALMAAHEAGVVHRDVKPANVLIGEDGTVKITDFGISRVISDLTLTATSTFAGTPAYLAPEVARGGSASFAADVYSLGATLYAAVEGAPPVGDDANAMKLLYRVSSGEITPPTQAGPMTDVLLWLLSDDPEKRPSMTEARDALAAVTEERSDAAPVAVVPAAAAPAEAPAEAGEPAEPAKAAGASAAPAASSATPTARRRRQVVAVAAGLVAVAVVAALVTMLFNRNGAASGDDRAAGGGSSSSARKPASTTTSTTTGTTTTERTTTTTPPPATSGTPTGQPVAATPVAAVNEYYALVPGNRDEAWKRLSPKFQQNPGGGRQGYYERFWSNISSVTATGAVQVGTNKVQVNLVYTRKDGSQSRERHEYTLVQQNGMWLLDSVRRLSAA